jgi:site-specific DNA recombinase
MHRLVIVSLKKNKERTIIVEKKEAVIIRFIYDSYLSNVPLNKIKQQANELGFDRNGNIAVELGLAHPAYAGLVYTKSFKDHPGGLFPAQHEPIIDKYTCQMVQE